jgi:hypothetical protein
VTQSIERIERFLAARSAQVPPPGNSTLEVVGPEAILRVEDVTELVNAYREQEIQLVQISSALQSAQYHIGRAQGTHRSFSPGSPAPYEVLAQQARQAQDEAISTGRAVVVNVQANRPGQRHHRTNLRLDSITPPDFIGWSNRTKGATAA